MRVRVSNIRGRSWLDLGPGSAMAMYATGSALEGTREPIGAHCPHGHLFTPANTRYSINGNRICKACQRVWNRTRRFATA